MFLLSWTISYFWQPETRSRNLPVILHWPFFNWLILSFLFQFWFCKGHLGFKQHGWLPITNRLTLPQLPFLHHLICLSPSFCTFHGMWGSFDSDTGLISSVYWCLTKHLYQDGNLIVFCLWHRLGQHQWPEKVFACKFKISRVFLGLIMPSTVQMGDRTTCLKCMICVCLTNWIQKQIF